MCVVGAFMEMLTFSMSMMAISLGMGIIVPINGVTTVAHRTTAHHQDTQDPITIHLFVVPLSL